MESTVAADSYCQRVMGLGEKCRGPRQSMSLSKQVAWLVYSVGVIQSSKSKNKD